MTSTLAAYYRLGDATNQTSIADSSGNGNTGTLINGVSGLPAFGGAGAFLYDTTTCLDLTNTTNTANGGFTTNNYATEPPTVQDPLSEASEWTVEMWFKWTGGSDTIPTPAVIPAGLTTPITRPSVDFPGGSFASSAAGSVIFTAAYGAIGDLAILGITLSSSTITVSSLSGITSGDWTLQVRNQDGANGECVDIWTSTVTSVAAADVVTIEYSGATSGVSAYYWLDSFTVGQGSNTIWAYPDVAVYQSNTPVTTATYPALLADAGTNPQAYWGIARSSATMSGGSTPGFTYEDQTDSEIAFNLDVYPGGNPWEPTSTTGSGTFTTAGMIVEASISTAASAPAVPNGVLMHVSGVNEFEPFTSYELQVGFAEINSAAPNQTNTISNAIVEAFGEYDGCNVYTYASNPLDGNWHYVAKCNGLPYPYLDGAAPTSMTGTTAVGGNVSGILMGTAPGAIGLNPNDGNAVTTTAVPFIGSLQDVAMYITDLSSAQITNHFNTGMWFQVPEYGASVGSAAAGRFNKVLTVAGLNPENILVVPYAFGTELYAETDVVTTTSGLNYAQTTTESEPGLIYQGPNGLIYAFNREYQYLNPTSITPQATISDSENSPYFYDGPSLAIAGDDIDIWSDIQVQSGIPATATTAQVEVGQLQEFGPVQSPLMAYSASVYGSRTLQGLTSLQMAHDSDALAIAQFYGMIYYLPVERVTQMVLNAQGNSGANIPQMLQRRIYDQFEIQYTGQTPGPTFSQASLIESITHTVDMNWPSWSTSYAMSPYEILLPAFYLDSSTTNGPDVLVL